MKRLSTRAWLALGLAVVIAVPLVVGRLLYLFLPVWLEPDPRARLMWEVSASADRWVSPAWQESLRPRLSALDMDAVIWDHRGQELFRTADGLVPEEGYWVQAIPNGVGKVLYKGRGGQPLMSHPVRERILSEYLPLLAGLTALLAALAVAAWLVSRALLRPLAAMSRAARQIAGGELAFDLPDSRVREVADVAAAFAAMGDALRASLERQADLEQQRRLLISAVAHDLRTPLFALRGHLEGLESGLADTPEKAARYVGICREKADALERLVADLFAYARMEYLEEVPRREPLELGALLGRIADSFRPLALSKGVAIRLAGPQGPCMVEADGHLLTRAVENLLDNAVRYTPPEGTVELAWERSDHAVRLTVRDEGPGIAPHDLPHLFAPMYRGAASRSRRSGGAGLGLAVARRMLQAHGGDLTAANGAPTGAVLTAVIPIQANR